MQVNEKKIKGLFGQKGTVTDVQLKYTEDGKFRRFGFVGFNTEQEAAAAKEYFNNTCIDTSRIIVDFCAGLGKGKIFKKYRINQGTVHFIIIDLQEIHQNQNLGVNMHLTVNLVKQRKQLMIVLLLKMIKKRKKRRKIKQIPRMIKKKA